MDEPTPPASPLEKLTVTGRWLLLLILLPCGAFGCWVLLEIADDLRPGQRFPLFFLTVPILGCGALVYAGIARILEKRGVRIFVRGKDEHRDF